MNHEDSNCKWITITSAVYAYGTDIVRNVLDHVDPKTSLLLAPIDKWRKDGSDSPWHQRCIGLEATASINLLSYATEALPKIARVDLASVFFSREKLLMENVAFGNFTDPWRFHCLGCNDGYFTQYLVRNRGWRYKRLPIAGLRSIVFHGPSPTLCIASGNVWFDHPRENKVGCLSHETVLWLYQRDVANAASSADGDSRKLGFDWEHFFRPRGQGLRICLRLSQYGYFQHGSEYDALSLSDVGSFSLNNPEQQWKLKAVADTQSSEGSKICDWAWYLDAHPDLNANGIATYEQAMQHYFEHGHDEGRPCAKPQMISKQDNHFDWHAYFELNFDLQRELARNEHQAFIHFNKHGYKEERPITQILPNLEEWSEALIRAKSFISRSAKNGIRTGDCALILYHLEDIGASDHAIDLTTNNVKIFVASVLRHHESMKSRQHDGSSNSSFSSITDQEAFYWFNVAGITDNPLASLLPSWLPNVAVVSWTYSSSAMNSHLRTLQLLQQEGRDNAAARAGNVGDIDVAGDESSSSIISSFGAVFCLSSGVRGPLSLHMDGQWLREYRRLLDGGNEGSSDSIIGKSGSKDAVSADSAVETDKRRAVGIVGPIISCEGGVAHVQTHAFGLRSVVVPVVLREFEERYYQTKKFVTIDEYFEVRLSASVVEAGYSMASFVCKSGVNSAVDACNSELVHSLDNLNNASITETSTHRKVTLGSLWSHCHVDAKSLILMRWGGESLSARGYLCGKGIAMDDSTNFIIRQLSEEVRGEDVLDSLRLQLPETLTGGPLGHLYEDSLINFESSATDDKMMRHRKVCIVLLTDVLVNVTSPDFQQKFKDSYRCKFLSLRVAHYPSHSLGLHCHSSVSLQRQSYGDWLLYISLPILRNDSSTSLANMLARDARIKILFKPPQYEGVHDTTSVALVRQYSRMVAQLDESCTFISFSSPGTRYGKNVVKHVVHAAGEMAEERGEEIGVIYSPWESAVFADADQLLRGRSGDWEAQCEGIEAMMMEKQRAYVVHPLAAVATFRNVHDTLVAGFFSKSKLKEFFHNQAMGNSSGFQQDAVFTSLGEIIKFLIRSLSWKYIHLPVDGFSSLVYGDPSPTWCIANGLIWFHHPISSKSECVEHRTVFQILHGFSDDNGKKFYGIRSNDLDWQHFFPGERMCIRLNRLGFSVAMTKHEVKGRLAET